MDGWITDEVEVGWMDGTLGWLAFSRWGRWVAALMEEMGTAANHAVAAINEWGRREATVSPLLLPELLVLVCRLALVFPSRGRRRL